MTNTMHQSCCGKSSANESAKAACSTQHYRPSVDVVEDASELRIVANLPGATADNVDIDYEEGTLTLHARVANRAAEGAKFLHQEYGIGDYRRAFQIGKQIDPSRITADFSAGVLTVHLPKLEAVKPRKVAVNVA